MPGYDGTGPRGEGPMTGGGFGYCGTGRPVGLGRAWPLLGLGLGLGLRWGARRFGGRWPGRGYGRGYGPGLYPEDDLWLEPPTREEEAAALEQDASFLRRRLEALEAHIAALREGKATGQEG